MCVCVCVCVCVTMFSYISTLTGLYIVEDNFFFHLSIWIKLSISI